MNHGAFAGKVLALAGGVGGARMADGLAQALPQGCLTVVVNTGDDFTHFGLAISPDLDTQLYTLAGLVDPINGWGRKDETWTFMSRMADLGGPTWFRLGDGDLALHVERTSRLLGGDSLSQITADFAAAHGLNTALLPMSDSAVSTLLDTNCGRLTMQDYFVRHRCQPRVHAIQYAGAQSARPSARVLAALADPALTAVVICPSNPYLSIDPILALPGIRDAMKMLKVPVVAVSPIVGGTAIKGPLAKLIAEFGLAVTPTAIADHYAGLIDGLVIDSRDSRYSTEIAVPCCVCDTVMHDAGMRRTLAMDVIEFAMSLSLARAQTTQRMEHDRADIDATSGAWTGLDGYTHQATGAGQIPPGGAPF